MNINFHCISFSGFSQQREKILPDAFDYLFHTFNQSFANLSSYRGYRLLACDGSDLAIAYNPADTQTHHRHNSAELGQKGYNQLHLNALYDLQNRIYPDALIQPGRYSDEVGALIKMIKRSPLQDKTILIADRGYECILTNLAEKDFPPEEIKKLYGLRWGIECSFREFKYTMGLTNFHAKKVEYIVQEVFVCLILYNYCERIVSGIVIVQKESVRHTYQVNFTIAVHICKSFFTGRMLMRQPRYIKKQYDTCCQDSQLCLCPR